MNARALMSRSVRVSAGRLGSSGPIARDRGRPELPEGPDVAADLCRDRLPASGSSCGADPGLAPARLEGLMDLERDGSRRERFDERRLLPELATDVVVDGRRYAIREVLGDCDDVRTGPIPKDTSVGCLPGPLDVAAAGEAARSRDEEILEGREGRIGKRNAVVVLERDEEFEPGRFAHGNLGKVIPGRERVPRVSVEVPPSGREEIRDAWNASCPACHDPLFCDVRPGLMSCLHDESRRSETFEQARGLAGSSAT